MHLLCFDFTLGCQRSGGSCVPTSFPQIIFCSWSCCIEVHSGLYWIQTGCSLSVLKEWEVLPSTFLSFGWGFFLQVITSISDLQCPARHYLVNNSHSNCSTTFFYHPLKRTCTESSRNKNSTSGTFLSLSWGYCLSTIRCLCRRWCCFLFWTVCPYDTCLISWLCTIQIGCLWTLTPKSAWKFARTCNDYS